MPNLISDLFDSGVIDYEALCHTPPTTPDLICTGCDYETNYENWYDISDFDSVEVVDRKFKKPEVCPKCTSNLERYL